jgi:hypothetical protein
MVLAQDKPMRQRFEAEPALNLSPSEKVLIPLRSRDELPPILAGRQWIGIRGLSIQSG